jgi:cytochrome c peroxidase
MPHTPLRTLIVAIAAVTAACGAEDDRRPAPERLVAPGDEVADSFVGALDDVKADTAGPDPDVRFAVLAAANTLDFQTLDIDAGLDVRAAEGIIAFRAGPDGSQGTADDRQFLTLEALDGIPWFGPRAYERLGAYALAIGLGPADFLAQRLDALGGSAGRAHFELPASSDLAAIPQDPRNPLTPAKVALGARLFHDRGLAVNGEIDGMGGTWSCASCHHVDAGFTSGNFQGFGEGGFGFGARGEQRVADVANAAMVDAQPVKSPSALNIAYSTTTLWNGQFGAAGPNVGTEAHWTEGTPKAHNHAGYHGVETQALAGLAVHRLLDATKPETSQGASCHTDPAYEALVDAAFPGTGPINQERAALAIAAYERTLLATEAPFQRWLAGDRTALSGAALRGAALFFGEAGCADCHTGPALSSDRFFKMGFADLADSASKWGLDEGSALIRETEPEADLGRMSFTGDPADAHAFKVPQLYNLADHAFFGHGSSFRSVADVVAYKAAAISENPAVPQIDLAPLALDAGDLDDLTAFLEEGLYDPALRRYVPAEPADRCGHTGDPQSLKDLGCPTP